MKTRSATPSFLISCLLALAACSDGGTSPVTDSAAGSLADAGHVDALGADATADAIEDAAASDVSSPDLASQPLPADVAPAKRIVPGSAQLVGAGVSACTNQVPPTGKGDRWCAFKRPGGDGKRTELWVIDVTKAAAGQPPPCDGTSPDCLRLTANLWTDEPYNGPRPSQAHRFDGDTLFFAADALSSGDVPYTGPVWAWRPGWPQARQLAAKAYICFGAEPVPAAFCADDITYNGQAPVELDLRVGVVSDPPGDVLPVLTHVRMQRADSEIAFRGGFWRGSEKFVYSTTLDATSNAAALYVARLQDGIFVEPQAVLPDVMAWDFSVDWTKVFYLTEFDHTAHAGRLTMADFPTGANPQLFPPFKVSRFHVLGYESGRDQGIGFFVEPHGRFLGEYRVVADRNALENAPAVFRFPDPLEGFDPSADHRFTGYAKDDPDQGFNGYIARNDGSGECILNAQINVPALEFAFLDHSSLVFWGEASPDGSSKKDGWLADPDGCRDRRLFAVHVGFYEAIRDNGLIFGDDIDQDDTVTLKYAPIANGHDWPSAGPFRIHDHVDFPVAILRPKMNQIVFQVSKGNSDEIGLYVIGPLPLGDP